VVAAAQHRPLLAPNNHLRLLAMCDDNAPRQDFLAGALLYESAKADLAMVKLTG